jgi:hypothetical protein
MGITRDVTTGDIMAKSRGRPKKSGGEGAQVRVEADLASMSRLIAARRGVKLIDYLSGLLRTAVERDFRKLMHEENKE